jgi:hypothetical protein
MCGIGHCGARAVDGDCGRPQPANTTPNTDMFAFTAPLTMMLHPNATFYFSNAAGISVSGYLVKFTR